MSKNIFQIYDLRTEYVKNPLNIDVEKPRFSWKLKSEKRGCFQKNYRVLVHKVSSQGEELVWDSGIVESSRTVEVVYDGKMLDSASRYSWDLHVTDNDGNVAKGRAFFETGLYMKEDWQGAKWIGKDFGTHAPLLRKFFNVDGKVHRARLYICGLGYFEAYLNGEIIGDFKLESPLTNYNKRVLYRALDVTKYVNEGKNCIGTELGRGFYGLLTDNVWNWHHSSWLDNPKVIAMLKIEYTDGRQECIVTDEKWEACAGPRTFDSVYLGEKYDARLEVPNWNVVCGNDTEDSVSSSFKMLRKWHPADIVSAPEGRLYAAYLPPIKKMETYEPVSVTNPAESVFVFDVGLITAGWAKLTARAMRGTEVKIRYGEKLDDRGRVITDNNCLKERENQTDTYIFKGTEEGFYEEFEPCFSYKGFRYVEVEGLTELSAENLTAYAVYTAVETVGSFECSKDLFNKIHEITVNTMTNNMHGIPTDTPYFEKNGWLGDANIMMDTFMLNFDTHAFFSKWMEDIRDSMLSKGRITLVAPMEQWGHGHSPQWNSAYITGLLCLYKYYGDERILKLHYASLLDYAAYEESELKNYISNSCLNDWCSPKHVEGRGWGAPEGNAGSATVYAFYIFKSVAYVAALLGDDENAVYYDGVAAKVLKAFNESFLVKDKGYYVDENRDVEYRQTPSILPLAFGMVPSDFVDVVFKNLVHDIAVVRDNHLNTGILGTKYLFALLSNMGERELAFKVATQDTFPSYGFWIANGATSLWEEWSLDSRSRNHYFFGTIDEWFFNYVAGLRVCNGVGLSGLGLSGYADDMIVAADGSVGAVSDMLSGTCDVKFVVKPFVMGDLEFAKASVESVWGLASVSWSVGEGFKMDVMIPANTKALIYVPKVIKGKAVDFEGINDGECSIKNSVALKFLGSNDEFFVFEAKSGNYCIKNY